MKQIKFLNTIYNCLLKAEFVCIENEFLTTSLIEVDANRSINAQRTFVGPNAQTIKRYKINYLAHKLCSSPFLEV